MPLEKPITCPVLVGRDAPRDALIRLAVDSGRIALISGEAGVGKSRLVSEAKTALQSDSYFVLEGRCFEPDQTLPYAPLVEMLANPDRFADYLRNTTPELAQLIPAFAPLLPPADAAVDPNLQKRRLYQSLVTLLTNIARLHPVIVIIEDLHWADDASLEFLSYFAHYIPAERIALILTYRGEEIGSGLERFLVGLERERIATEFKLSHLTLDEVRIMLDAIPDLPRSLPSGFLESLYELTEGNPFFIEEVLKSQQSAADLQLLHIPRTIQATVQRRIEPLSPAARQLLTLAAVMGRRFDFGLLQHLTHKAEQELVEVIKELMAAQLVIEETADRFVFRHTLTQRAVYSGLLVREQRAFHRLIAETIERLYHGSEVYVSDLAYHFYAAQVWAKAMNYAQDAGERARKLYAPRLALEHYTRALLAAGHLGLTPPPSLYRTCGQTCETLGDFEAALGHYEQALKAARQSHDRQAEWQGLHDLGWLWTGRNYARAGDYFQQAITLARDIGDSSMLAATLNRVGNWHVHQEHIQDGLASHQEAYTLFQNSGNTSGMATTLDLLGITSFMGGNLSAGAAYYKEAIPLFRQLDDRQGLANSLMTLGMCGRSYMFITEDAPITDFDSAYQLLQEALELTRQIGWRAGEATALIYLGHVLASRGDYAEALSCAQGAIEAAEDIGHQVWLASAHFLLGALYLDMLAVEEARQVAERGLSIAQESRSPFVIRILTGLLISVCAAQRDFARDESLLSDTEPMESLAQRIVWSARAEFALAQSDAPTALRITDRLVEAKRVVPHLWRLRAEALMMLRKLESAERLFHEAIATARQQRALPYLWRALLSLGKLYQVTHRREKTEACVDEAHYIIDSLADKIGDEALRINFRSRSMIPPMKALSPREAARRASGGLTAREREVATLIAQGLSNRAIAELLVLSGRTVEKHVENILSKLGFTARSQIAAWAVTRGWVKRGE
jgi:tetratricopeptide (TPR) repeat protein